MVAPSQIDLVRQSFAAVLRLSDGAGIAFYEQLFTLAPETPPLFGPDMKEQGRKLFMTLATLVDALDRLDQIGPVGRELALRHLRYGAQEHHDASVGTALVAAVGRALGPAFDKETEAA